MIETMPISTFEIIRIQYRIVCKHSQTKTLLAEIQKLRDNVEVASTPFSAHKTVREIAYQKSTGVK